MPAKAARKSTNTSPTLLTIPETCARLSCSENHVYRLISAGVLEAVDIAHPGSPRSKTRVRSDDLDAYIESCTRRARREPNPAA